jgi:CheY-like chemotaxis protein
LGERPPRILVVDDVPENVRLLEALRSSTRRAVSTASEASPQSAELSRAGLIE